MPTELERAQRRFERRRLFMRRRIHVLPLIVLLLIAVACGVLAVTLW